MRSLDEIVEINENSEAYFRGKRNVEIVAKLDKLRKEADDALNRYITAQRAYEDYMEGDN